MSPSSSRLWPQVNYGARSPKLIWAPVYSCTRWLRLPPLPPHLGSYTRALLVSQGRRHLFVTPWLWQTTRHLNFYYFCPNEDFGVVTLRLGCASNLVYCVFVYVCNPNSWLLGVAFGCWLYWLSVVSVGGCYWLLLVVGCQLSSSDCRLSGVSVGNGCCLFLVVGCRLLDVGCWLSA